MSSNARVPKTTCRVLPFPARRRRRSVTQPLFPAEVRPFPLTAYAGSVDRLARHLRSLPTLQQRSDAMVQHIEIEWNRLCDLGADERATEKELIDFANAVWAAVDRVERGGAA